MTRILRHFLRKLLLLSLTAILVVTMAIGASYWLLLPRLPSIAVLKDYHMQLPMRILSADDKLIATFGKVRRTPTDIAHIPAMLKYAVLSAEDADFYHHPGVNWRSIARAAWHVMLAGGRKVQGGSTITQQVARNFFLSPRKLYSRKLIEIFTALRMHQSFSKDQILELYLNKMFLGHRSYGVTAAAKYYYGKSLSQLSIAQCAAIAATFQLPSAVNPISDPQRLIKRRDWVLGQMLEHHYINQLQYSVAVATPDVAKPHDQSIQVEAPYLAEMVRQQLIQRFGKNALTEGYVVKTTIQSTRQNDAVKALRRGVITYDHRHGWRGAEAYRKLPKAPTKANLNRILANYSIVANMHAGIITSVSGQMATVYLGHGRDIKLGLNAMRWARKYISENQLGTAPQNINDILKRGDVVRVALDSKGHWALTQIPEVQAALISINPENGSIQAVVGGFSFTLSQFNRATMAARQPGSSFKPYFYAAAFDDGFTPASIINDAPLALPDPAHPDTPWTPNNDNGKFIGPTRLREALVQSKNLVSIRLLRAIGVGYARRFLNRFGFSQTDLPANLSLALGTAAVSPLEMARGYAVFANGGYLVTPYFIKEIDDNNGKVLYLANPMRSCRNCEARLLNPASAAAPKTSLTEIPNNQITDTTATTSPALAPHVLDIRTNYLMTSLLKDVILHGTGKPALALHRPDLAGKTGTTNNHRDAWFVGFNKDLSTAVWFGFDNFSSLGKHEFGSKDALPIWMDYMGTVLKNLPIKSLPMPPGIRSILINRNTGLPTTASDPNAMTEVFKVEDLNRLRVQAEREQSSYQLHRHDLF